MKVYVRLYRALKATAPPSSAALACQAILRSAARCASEVGGAGIRGEIHSNPSIDVVVVEGLAERTRAGREAFGLPG